MSALRLFRARGAGDFVAEKRERALRMRVSGSLLSGAGTVWGLTAAVSEKSTAELRTRVIVRAGLAVDAFGRELYVDREQCLDVEALAQHPIWRELMPPEGAVSSTVRRAYIVLRHEVCEVATEPAVASGQGPEIDPYEGAPPDHFRIELCPAPPPAPEVLRHDGFAALAVTQHQRDMRDARLDFLLQEHTLAPAPPALPDGAQGSAPLLLATLDLDTRAALAFIVESTPKAPNPDNRVRTYLPGARSVAESLFGKRAWT